MPDDHSELVPPLPIPNRTVKRDRANDIAHPGEKVGQRQTPIKNAPAVTAGAFYSLLLVQTHLE